MAHLQYTEVEWADMDPSQKHISHASFPYSDLMARGKEISPMEIIFLM